MSPAGRYRTLRSHIANKVIAFSTFLWMLSDAVLLSDAEGDLDANRQYPCGFLESHTFWRLTGDLIFRTVFGPENVVSKGISALGDPCLLFLSCQ
jgi:hypothetical protein